MKIQILLTSAITRWCLSGFALIIFGGVTTLASLRFIVSAVTNPRLPVELSTIESALTYFPDSAKLHARLTSALIESQTGNTESHEAMAARAFQHAMRAAQLAPENHEYQLLLAAAAELRGEMGVAEESLRKAIALAPSDVNVRWQMANLYLRVGNIEEALAEFRFVAAADQSRLPAVMSLVWQATGNDLAKLDQTIGREAQDRLALAQFLVEQTQFDASAQVFNQIDRDSRLRLPASANYFNAMLNAGQWRLAGKLWDDTMSDASEGGKDLFWNGSFERPVMKSFAHFDWQFSPSNFARLQITVGQSHSGQHALTITYQGQETTRLDGEAKHAVPVRPGAGYRLEFFAKSEKLVAPDGPRIAILRTDNRAVIANSASVPTGSNDWQRMAVDFTAPADIEGVWIAVKQTPEYSYVEPTSGVVRFDDFSLKAHSLN